MGSYLIRRILLIIPTLFLVTVIIFFIIRLVPGDIVELMAAEMAEEATGEVNPEDIREMLGLDIPVHIQYVRWITAIITRGDLGKSLWTERSVTEDIINRFPVSFELGALALIISIVIALPVGFYSAIRQDSAGDYFGRIFAIGMLALPNFWLATMLFVFPSIWWNWSPPVKLIPFSEDPIGNLKQFLIPAFLMGTAMSATIMRMTRTMALEVLRQDYVRTACSGRIMSGRHGQRDSKKGLWYSGTSSKTP
jgi:peptide/nickel transport system permease protein